MIETVTVLYPSWFGGPKPALRAAHEQAVNASNWMRCAVLDIQVDRTNPEEWVITTRYIGQGDD